jgi:hypothetical protein
MPSPVAVWSFWIAVCACAVGQIAILRDAVSLRGTRAPQSGTGPDADASPTLDRATAAAEVSSGKTAPRGPGHAHAAGEVIWAVLPGIALVFVLLWTWRAMHTGAGTPAPRVAAAVASAVAAGVAVTALTDTPR